MNRVIKFRAWDKEESKIMTVDMLRLIGGKIYQQIGLIRDGVVKLMNIDSVVLMQSTGLKDKNGIEIYEGDVVKWSDGEYKSDSNPRVAVVEFTPELAFYAINVKDFGSNCKYTGRAGYGHKFGYSNFIYKDTDKHFEVVGNIYENKELIQI